MNAKIMTALLATFVMLFAGVAVASGEDVSADDVPPTPEPAKTSFVVSYVVGTTTYTDTFSVDGEVLSTTYALKSLESLNATVPDGKNFLGWYKGASLPEQDVNTLVTLASGSSDNIATEVKFIAVFSEIKYGVTFLDSDDREISKQTNLAYGVEIPVPGVKTAGTPGYIIPDDMVFVEWVDADGNAVALEKNGKLKVTETIVLKATYKADVKVTFIVDGITTYNHVMTDLVYPTDPVKDDFTFLGWAVDGETVLDAGADLADLKALKLEANTTLTAVFEPALHVVTFAVDGVAVSTQTVKHGEFAIEPAFIPAKDGYDFVAWDFDFRNPIMADMTINATFTETVAPEPEGLDDPVTQTFAIIGGLLAIIVLAVFVSKVRKGEPILGVKFEKAKKKDKEDEE